MKFHSALFPNGILVQGWLNIPHSYAIVNAFQLYAFHVFYPDLIIYFKEMPYYAPAWNKIPPKSIFPTHIQNFLATIKPYNNEPVDLIYRIAFPYDVERPRVELRENVSVPIVIFYTSEIDKMPLIAFKPYMPEEKLTHVLSLYTNLFFVTPSEWSSRGMATYVDATRNRIIPHGIDLDIFYRTDDAPHESRAKFNIPDDKIVFLHAGAMTLTKGPMETIYAFYLLLKRNPNKYHLVLKCSQDLYNSMDLVANHLSLLQKNCPDILDVVNPNLTLIPHILTFEEMNALYNSVDFYMALYSGEGFNLIPLEAVATGCRIIVNQYGGGAEYTDDLKSDLILALPSSPADISATDGSRRMAIDVDKVLPYIQNFISQEWNKSAYVDVRDRISRRF